MYNSNHEEQVPVLIVGGSVVGLSTALFLALHGIQPLLVERHATTSIHTRAAGFNARTMELYRQAGIESDIQRLETPPEQMGEIGLHVETLAGKELPTSEAKSHQQFQITNPFASPTRMAMVGQDQLEPVLQEHASALGCDIRFNTELIDFEQDTEGVHAHIRDRGTGSVHSIFARYLIAADGNRSAIRQQLGISTYGYGRLGQWVSILFQTDLSHVLHGRNIALCFVNNPHVSGIIGQSQNRWSLFANVEDSDDFSEERCRELVRAAIGLPDQPVKILSILPWETASRVATHYQQGRVLLAGDAAHVMTTMGAFGANTGIADAHNLAWKLALVLKQKAPARLLETYEQERQPAAELAVAVSTGLYAYRLPQHKQREAILQSAQEMLACVRKSPDAPDPTAFSVMNGYRYRSAAILSEDDTEPTLFENEPSGRPGTRAPHVWLTQDGQRCSTLDLYGKQFVLLTGPEGHLWSTAFTEAARQLDIPLVSYTIGQHFHDQEESFLACYGIGASGATLIRPDGFIAWRSQQANDQPVTTLLRHLLCYE
ncbi:putative polyketide hydroxylase/tetracenomycin A2 monooxygenase-dioxygenase [Thermosporothrix hazakensis]|jgi:2-polyprenyl-6-methoxyphenol hydroxylase-like FAD-dependent oxidoreductase|uniref:Putative polyketide hydroxylase/tetracenomycin A2 monooxygenase-dioxygenase n=1 Tax=Thermosporothrix hazakensis TaxID=644383 RepID=A0A326U937_THEHA|nr:FAD-dependent monooxygenase [Thermosporothrix hazakensis]PZW32706.1 putative polyketide hydroxylase/tetracenomycin A2 monooxygenase-dioxygenase [Thermosporothrix hazakensis]GCE50061.1 FAD-dependent oxidoreductase [Thermosporothrix hazakensis]